MTTINDYVALEADFNRLKEENERLRAQLSAPAESAMVHFSDDQIKHIVDRFLGWRVPSSFNPDGGIVYTPARQLPGIDRRPFGTNLLSAEQAEAMVRYIVDGMRALSDAKGEPKPYSKTNECPSCKEMYTDGQTCRAVGGRGGCPMGGDF